MMITITEAHVAKENWPLLEQAYQRNSQQTPPGFEQSFLVHSIEDQDLWQIITVWSDMTALQQIQKAKVAGVTPRGSLIFQEAHAQTTHTVFEVVQQRVSAPKET
ncbi:MAG TPA: antibiotic biosynthesis monooxygenase [Anaerolineaceae bacterium]|nr:antibiotic biosynthesis monooxygenase [Anaerolineaceae bacterium]